MVELETFCPLINGKCKTECVLHYNYSDTNENACWLQTGLSNLVPVEEDDREYDEEATSIFLKTSPEKIAIELVDFHKLHPNLFFENYWEEKRIETHKTTETIEKMRKIEQLARQILDKEFDEKIKETIDNCSIWAKNKNLPKITEADLESFLFETDYYIKLGKKFTIQQKQVVRSSVNLRLKNG